MGLTSYGQHSLTFPASSLFQPRCTTQPSFNAFQPEGRPGHQLVATQVSLKQCPSLEESKSFALLINKSVSWQITLMVNLEIACDLQKNALGEPRTQTASGGRRMAWAPYQSRCFPMGTWDLGRGEEGGCFSSTSALG